VARRRRMNAEASSAIRRRSVACSVSGHRKDAARLCDSILA